MPITNLSSNNTPAAIERYRQNYDRAFGKPSGPLYDSPKGELSIIIRCPICGRSHEIGYLKDIDKMGRMIVGYKCGGMEYKCEWVKREGERG